MSEQPRNTAGDPSDELWTYLGDIPQAEYQARAKLRDCRNFVAWRVTNAKSATARQLLWLAAEWAFDFVFAPASTDFLEDVAKLCQRLLAAAEHAEKLGADHDA